MPKVNLGRVGFVLQGNHSTTKTYKRLDCVMYNNATYAAIEDVPTGTAITNTQYWQLLIDANGILQDIDAFKDHLIMVQDTEPTEADNRLWIKSTQGDEVQIPTWAEHEALAGEVDKKTIKHLLTYDGTNIKEDSTVLTYAAIHAMLMDKPDFVVLVYNERAYHPTRVSNDQIVFIASFVSNGYPTMDRISISNKDVVTVTTGTAEMKVNKVSSVNDANKADADKYPSVKAVVDYVQPTIDETTKIKSDISQVSESIVEIRDELTDTSEEWSDYTELEAIIRSGRINVGQSNQTAYPDGSILNDGTDTLYVIKRYDLPNNSRIKIDYSTVQNKVANYAFYSTEDTLISIFPTGAIGAESAITNVSLDVPQNASYILCCTRKTQENNLHLYVSTKNTTTVLDTSIIQKTLDAMTDRESCNIENVHVVDADGQKNVVGIVNRVKYPRDIVFGGEYLEHWYEKIYDGTQNVVVDIEGDSISQGYTGQNVFLGMRDHAIKRIMKSGGYDLSKVSVYNNAIGGCSTNEWVGRTEYFKESWKSEQYYTQYANGMLAYGMGHNPDLMIIGFGMNDAEIDVNNLSLKERLDLFETNFREAMDRVRGSVPINGRPAYGKTVDDLSIIVTNITNTVADQYRYYENWQIYVRDLLAKLCREYQCAYADFTQLTYGYTDNTFTSWRQVNTSGQKVGLHPNKYQAAYWMSSLADLIYPVCMHNIEV